MSETEIVAFCQICKKPIYLEEEVQRLGLDEFYRRHNPHARAEVETGGELATPFVFYSTGVCVSHGDPDAAAHGSPSIRSLIEARAKAWAAWRPAA